MRVATPRHDFWCDFYQDFLAPRGGYPIINKKGKWILDKKIPSESEKENYFASLVNSILMEQENICQLPNIENFVKRVNCEWMKSRRLTGSANSKDRGVKEIWFNSKSRDYFWLSNLFATLIYSENPSKIFMGVETAYKAHKAQLASDMSVEKMMAITQMTDLKAAQKIKVKIHDNSEEQLVSIMKQLIHYKFSQNSYLQNYLLATDTLPLVEHTDHPFWGDGSSTSSEEKGSGLNMLGRILMEERESIRANLLDESSEKDS